MPASATLATPTSFRSRSFIQSPLEIPSIKAHKRLLVVDDCSEGRRMMVQILRCLGLDAEVAENGRTACDLAVAAWKRGQAFDLILMDIQMPGTDGLQATTELRSKGYGGRIVALASGCTYDMTYAKCPAAGCDGYARKPITFQMLRDVCRRWIPGAGIDSSCGKRELNSQ